MRTELIEPTDAGIARAAARLRAGDLVAFPTETVYGLGARADRADAVRRIYAAKGRPESRPLIVHLASAAEAPGWVLAWTAEAERLARRFWPGPLTLVLERAPTVIDEVTAGGRTVALRVPAHPTALRLLAACRLGIAAPSANRFGESPPRSGVEVQRSLGGLIPLVLDAGEIPWPALGRPPVSTILDLTCRPPRLLRPGALPAEAIAATLGQDVERVEPQQA